MKRPIGIFDSGIGGLTVMKEAIKILPNERFIYLGDTARVPYGDKSEVEIASYGSEIIQYLESLGVKAVIIACNTASVVFKTYEERFSLPLFEMIEPGVLEAVKATKNNIIGVVGTQSTIASKAHEKSILEKKDSAEIVSTACPLLVPLVETGLYHHPETKELLIDYLTPLLEKNIDTLVLGCTHYPLLRDLIENVVGDIVIIDPAKQVAMNLQSYLEGADLLAPPPDNQKEVTNHQFFVTGKPYAFSVIAADFLGDLPGGMTVTQISLPPYRGSIQKD